MNQIALAKSKQIKKDLDPSKNVLCESGGDGIFNAFVKGQLKAGDEAILIEPFFTWYPVLYYHNIDIKYARPAFNEEKCDFEEFDF